ncbi:hypothetical protein PAEVO_40270 [Paenibacillus sp. GM2FR]|uniref:hypothetical protein n=1 Tax=Paenibacillus sp. GM2FR TaxID=2059268 RepID=UPI000C270C4D|nr:hypothetical protein [Paenibacillus sp. GM2FR]PJN57293.1 hypothetical protein PAEVO_40270 [Paenibacillus sp. GM2FR]
MSKLVFCFNGTNNIRTIDVGDDASEVLERIKHQKTGWIELKECTINLDNVNYVVDRRKTKGQRIL